MAALKYWLWLTNLPGLSIRSQWLLLTAFFSPEEIYYAGEEQLRMAGDCLRVLQIKRIEEKIAALQKELVTQSGDEKRKTLLKIKELTKERQTAGRKE